MREHRYGIDTAWIVGGLFLAMAAAMELGHRPGLRRAASTAPATREHINGIQSAMLGILALLLGFTFSLALQRYESRSEAVVAEANAIGTAWLRTALLPPSARDELRALMRRCTAVRVEMGQRSALDLEAQRALAAEVAQLQDALWSRAAQAVRAELQAPGPALQVDAVNALIVTLVFAILDLDRPGRG